MFYEYIAERAKLGLQIISIEDNEEFTNISRTPLYKYLNKIEYATVRTQGDTFNKLQNIIINRIATETYNTYKINMNIKEIREAIKSTFKFKVVT